MMLFTNLYKNYNITSSSHFLTSFKFQNAKITMSEDIEEIEFFVYVITKNQKIWLCG